MKKELASDHIFGPHQHSSFLHWFEWFTDLIIPYLLVILAVELIVDNPFWTLYSLEHLEPFVHYLDNFVLFFFVVDLCFKWTHVRNLPRFLKLYWLDIIAVLPLYLGFRVYARFASIAATGEEIAELQKLTHEAVLAREARLIKEAEMLIREEKLLKEAGPISRGLQTMERSLRFVSGRQEVAQMGMKHAILKSEN
ncbi:MAG: hypothetical protein AABY01_03625 [Nanoarchaeota archaeon]